MQKKKWFLIVALLYILYTIFPLFADIFSIPVWLPSMFAVGMMAILYPSAFKNKCFYWFLAYAVVLSIYVLMGKPLTIGIGSVEDSKKIFIEFAYLLPSIGILGILQYLGDDKLNKKLVVGSLIILYVSFVIEIPLMQRYGSIRAALGEQGEELKILGLPGYSLMHAYTLMIPAACYAVRISRKRMKLLAIAALSVLAFAVYDTFVTTSLLLMVVTIVFSIFYNEKNTPLLVFVFILLAMIFFILYKAGVFISLIDWVMPAFEGTAVESKLMDFRQSMVAGQLTGGTILARLSLHEKSWLSFLQNPLIGTSLVGGHSALLDRLGGMGLFAFIPFIMMVVSSVKVLKSKIITKHARAFFMIGVIMGFVFMYSKGLWGGEAWLMYWVLMPYSIYVLEQHTLIPK